MTDWEKRSLQRAKRIFPGRFDRLQKKSLFFFLQATRASDPASSAAGGQGSIFLSARGGSEGFLLLAQE